MVGLGLGMKERTALVAGDGTDARHAGLKRSQNVSSDILHADHPKSIGEDIEGASDGADDHTAERPSSHVERPVAQDTRNDHDTTTTTTTTTTPTTTSIFASEASCRYPGDEFPMHLPEQERKKLASKYRAIPEEYYTKTRRRVITPHVLEAAALAEPACGLGLLGTV